MTPATTRLALAGLLAFAALPAQALEPFVARYQAWHGGKELGAAILQAKPTAASQWRMDLDVRAERGVAGFLGLDMGQSTVFAVEGGEHYRPLSLSTVKPGLFGGKKISGNYDWAAKTSRWDGKLKKTRTAPVPLQEGDLNGLLLDLAVVRDAAPGKALAYRVVENGRARDHQYAVGMQPEIVAVDDIRYSALRVERSNGGNDETIFWIADGVPTPVRILMRENGVDAYDLRLVEYQGVN
jgi:hypothetical protein